MVQERNDYLISSSMKKYLMAAIAAMLINNLNAMIDGILMGRLLGSSAFSAVNLCLPMVGLITACGMLFYVGSDVLASMAAGAREERKACVIYTVSLISVAVLSIVITAGCLSGLPVISSLICREEALLGYVSDYLSVCFAGSSITMISAALLSFAQVAGKPSLVAHASLVTVCTNIICDILYVGFFRFGIRGAAAATLTGSLFAIILILADSFLKGSQFHFVNPGKEFLPVLKENVRYGFPLMTQSLAIVAYSYLCNMCAQKFGGVKGAFAVSMLTYATILCQGVSGGIGQSFNAIGGMLKGQKDDVGVYMLYKKGIRIAAAFSAAVCVVIMAAAPLFARLMGAEDQEIIRYSARSLRMALPFVVPICILWIMPAVYALSGELSILPVISFSQPVLTVIGLYLCGTLIGNDYMWLGYPAAAVLCFLILVIIVEKKRRGAKDKRAFLSLLPVGTAEKNVYDISVICDPGILGEQIRQLDAFFDQQDIAYKQGLRIRLCMEEMMANIIEHAERKKSQYFDLKVVVDEESILAVIRDDGQRFDPVHAENMGTGLKIVKSMCKDIDYTYVYGLNMVFLKWMR